MNDLDRRGIAELEATGIPWAAVQRWLDELDPREAFVARTVVKQVLQALADDKAPLREARGPQRALPAADRRRYCRLKTTRPIPGSYIAGYCSKNLSVLSLKTSTISNLFGALFDVPKSAVCGTESVFARSECHDAKRRMPKRVALYVRTSTANGQTTRNQERELQAVAERHGWKVAAVYRTRASAGPRDGISALASRG